MHAYYARDFIWAIWLEQNKFSSPCLFFSFFVISNIEKFLGLKNKIFEEFDFFQKKFLALWKSSLSRLPKFEN